MKRGRWLITRVSTVRISIQLTHFYRPLLERRDLSCRRKNEQLPAGLKCIDSVDVNYDLLGHLFIFCIPILQKSNVCHAETNRCFPIFFGRSHKMTILFADVKIQVLNR